MIEATDCFKDITPHVCSCLLIIAEKAIAKQLRAFDINDFYPHIKRAAFVYGKLEDAGYIERCWTEIDKPQQWQFTYNYLQCLAYHSIEVKIKLPCVNV